MRNETKNLNGNGTGEKTMKTRLELGELETTTIEQLGLTLKSMDLLLTREGLGMANMGTMSSLNGGEWNLSQHLRKLLGDRTPEGQTPEELLSGLQGCKEQLAATLNKSATRTAGRLATRASLKWENELDAKRKA